jgi:integrase
MVFPPIFGQGLRENMSHLFAELVDRIGFNKGLPKDDRQRRVVFHALRHAFASWLALAGVDIYRIKTLMRHKTLDMTMRYAHLIPDATHEAVPQLAPLLKKY